MKKLLLILLIPIIGFGQDLAIGNTYQGGIIFYLDEDGGGLIAAPSDQSSKTQWGCWASNYNNFTGADQEGIGTGRQNTIDILDRCLQISAAYWCDDYTKISNGITYDDWFLPSKDELNEIYLNIGQGSSLGNVGGFDNDYYWSSTEFDNDNAWEQDLGSGFQDFNDKDDYGSVRAVRAF